MGDKTKKSSDKRGSALGSDSNELAKWKEATFLLDNENNQEQVSLLLSMAIIYRISSKEVANYVDPPYCEIYTIQ